ncbi:MAG: FapA family protein [Candidatus Coatesbacteria bacterium]
MAPIDTETEADAQAEVQEGEEQVQAGPVRNLDGFAYHYRDKRGDWLVVQPPAGDGKPEDSEKVERELRAKNLENVNWDLVRKALKEQSGKGAWILNGVDPEEEARRAAEQAALEAAMPKEVDKSTYVFVTVSEDQTSAKLTLVPPEDRRIEITMDDVQKALTTQSVSFGILEDRMAEVQDICDRIRDGDWTEPVEMEIAHGVDPVHGQDAQFEPLFEQMTEGGVRKPMGESADGRVDYFAVKDIENTKRGQAIARRIPPTQGTSGKSVRGEEIPARDGTDAAVEIGGGVERALGNDNIFVAAIDGQPKFADGKLTVQALYEIEGDVDLSTGSIDFIGTVIVKNNVQPGFKIMAGEDVIVEGVVDDAEIHAAGKVTVKGGVLGQGGKAKIVAGGDVTAKYIRNAAIESKGTLTAHEGILHSKVSAKSVKLTGKRGQIVGGEIFAEVDIIASTIGSNTMATPTVLVVGENPARRAEINGLTERVKAMEEELDKAQKGMVVLKAQRERTGTLAPDKSEMLAKFTRASLKINTDLKPLQERLQQIVAEDEEQRKHHQAKISVAGTMYPGVKITIRNAKKHVVEELRYCTLTEKGSDVKVGPYK